MTQLADENWRYRQRMRAIEYIQDKFAVRHEIEPGFVDFFDYKLPRHSNDGE